MNVIRLGPEDSTLLAETLQRLKSPPGMQSPSAACLERFLARPENILLVALRDGVPEGFLVAYLLDRADRDQRMVCLYEIGVAEGSRRQGIGRALIETLKDLCKEQDAMKAWVITNRANRAAVSLFESSGAAADTEGDSIVFVYGPHTYERSGT